jgi:hypothetical protein
MLQMAAIGGICPRWGIDKLLILQLAATDASAVQFPAILDWTPTSLEISADFRLFGFIPPPLPPPI